MWTLGAVAVDFAGELIALYCSVVDALCLPVVAGQEAAKRSRVISNATGFIRDSRSLLRQLLERLASQFLGFGYLVEGHLFFDGLSILFRLFIPFCPRDIEPDMCLD